VIGKSSTTFIEEDKPQRRYKGMENLISLRVGSAKNPRDSPHQFANYVIYRSEFPKIFK